MASAILKENRGVKWHKDEKYISIS